MDIYFFNISVTKLLTYEFIIMMLPGLLADSGNVTPREAMSPEAAAAPAAEVA